VTAEPTPAAQPVSDWNIANIITMARIALVPFFVWALLAAGWPVGNLTSLPLRWTAVAIFAVAALTDKVDGYLARSRNLVTDLGKLLDPIADKALVGVALVLLWIPMRELPWWVPVVVLVREFGITFMRMGLKKYEVMPASRGGKLKTVLQTVAIGLFCFPLANMPHFITVIAWGIMSAAIAVTLVTGIDYAHKGWMIRQAARADK
jgi:CDP-diacylglycerol--glycerol-3-phosphate 3-phosphatidyltransferase/cardiolipin synthase